MKKEKIEYDDLASTQYNLPVMLRTNKKKFELLARLSYRKSQQSVIDALLFPPGWKQRLGVLQRKQRARGIPDEEFLHSKLKRAMGIHVKPGRKPIIHPD